MSVTLMYALFLFPAENLTLYLSIRKSANKDCRDFLNTIQVQNQFIMIMVDSFKLTAPKCGQNEFCLHEKNVAYVTISNVCEKYISKTSEKTKRISSFERTGG